MYSYTYKYKYAITNIRILKKIRMATFSPLCTELFSVLSMVYFSSLPLYNNNYKKIKISNTILETVLKLKPKLRIIKLNENAMI